MRVWASVEVEVVEKYGGYTFRKEVLEVEILQVGRWAADKLRTRFYYFADVVPPKEVHPEAGRLGVTTAGLYRVNIDRKLNPRWKPPVFPPGCDSIGVAAGTA